MKKYRWHFLSRKKFDQRNFSELLPTLLKNRGLKPGEYQNFLQPPTPESFQLSDLGVNKTDLEKSVARLNQAHARREKVIVFGDYDVDGFAASALVWENFYHHGWDILPFLPHRLRDGYGLQPVTVHRLHDLYPQMKLLLTVDNGISAVEAIREAKRLGIDTVIIDHHLRLQKKSLPAVATVHSEQVSAGALAWFWLREWFQPDLGLAALSTISDVMPLKGVNRSLVKFGLPVLAKTSRVGLRSLFRQAGIKFPLDVYQVGFLIAPRLNALGRIAEPMDALRLLCAPGIVQGQKLAALAGQTNSRRQHLVEKGLQLARQKLSQPLPPILVVADESYHRGIIGLIAARLLEEFARPTLVIAQEGDFCYGSARSPEGVDITRLLRRANRWLLEVGGHQKAAGFRLKTSLLPRFQETLAELGREIRASLLVPRRQIDAELDPALIGQQLYQQISLLEPFGEGNPRPVFVSRGLRIAHWRTFGQDQQHLKIFVYDPRQSVARRQFLEVVAFGYGPLASSLLVGDYLDLAFSLRRDVWQGEERITLHLRDLKLVR